MASRRLPLSTDAGKQSETWWRALDESLSIPRPPSPTALPDQLRGRLRHLLQRVPQDGATANEALARLRAIAGGAAPDAIEPTPAALAEDVASVRCLIEQPDGARELAAVRAYLKDARPDDSSTELAADLAVTREQLSFVTLLSQPHQLDSMRATFELFQDAYRNAYVKHHETYGSTIERLQSALADAAAGTNALRRLNTLRALGPPLAEAKLAAYDRLAALRPCSHDGLAVALRDLPLCPACHLSLVDRPPSEEVDLTLRDLRSALARQQQRLAGEAVRRVLARGGERIERFLELAQAADVAALANVLDDELLSFLRDLLAEPVAPTPEALELFEQLARAHPAVGMDDVDAAADTLRVLLRERLAARNGSDASIRLAQDGRRP